MSKQTQGLAAGMPSTEELKTAGIRELSAEELLEVNGGRQVEGAISSYGPDPDIPDDPPSSSGSSSDNSSDSSGGSSGSSSTSNDSSSDSGSSETSSGSSIDSSSNTSEDTSSSSSGSDTSDDTGGYTDYPEAGYTDEYESGGSSGESTSDTGSNASEDTSSSSSSDTSNDNSSDSYEDEECGSYDSSCNNPDAGSSDSGSSSPSYEDEESGSYSYSSSNETPNNNSSNSSSSSSSYPDKGDSSSYAKNHSESSSGGESSYTSPSKKNGKHTVDAGFNPETEHKRESYTESKRGFGERISSWFNRKREETSNSPKQRFRRASKDSTVETQNGPTGQEKQSLSNTHDKTDELLKDKKKEEPLFSGKIIKQKELEQKYDYPNTLCYLTDIANMYRIKDGLEDKGVDNFMKGAKDVYIKPDGEVPDFSKTSKALAKESNASMYYEYVYPKESGYQLLKLSEESFKSSDYEFGIAECYKTGDSSKDICHFILVQNKPWQKNDPGTGLNDYTISQIRPVQRLKMGE